MIRVSIRPLRQSDAEVSWKWRNNPAVWEFTGSRPDRWVTPEMELEWIDKVLSDPTTSRFAIMAGDNGHMSYVGNVQLTDITESEAQYHIFIGDVAFWGKGIGEKATRLILDHAFNSMQLSKVWLLVNKNNLRAVNLYERIGFTMEEERENAYLMEISFDGLSPAVSGGTGGKLK